MKRTVSLLVLLISLVSCNALKAEPKTEEYAIIVGKPYKIKDSKNILPGTDRVMIASLYVVYFKDYRVVAGELEPKRVLKVEIQASSGSIIQHHEEIYVVVKKSDDKILDGGVRWGEPMYRVCLPEEILDEIGLTDEFGTAVISHNRKCRGIYQHGYR